MGSTEVAAITREAGSDAQEARRRAAFEATTKFEASRQAFLRASRDYLTTQEIDLQMRWHEVAGTVSAIRQLWHLAEGG